MIDLLEGAQRVHISAMREMADALWEGSTHTVEDWTECAQTHTQTDKQTKVKTVYLSVSLRSLGG